ncbi:hypothetical protein [Clostridium cavendishii]|uniref:hypothetical protein n=1 Tax=Clostridium cavendishii TaxID=349931 RepID=UPI00093549BE|nr:hypothetical protein [Clostridium cavendishii]
MKECNFKIRTTIDDAKERYLKLMSPKEEYEWDDIQKSFHIGEVYISQKDGYILFEDMNGEAFFGWETSLWIDFAGKDEVVYAYYDEDGNAEVVYIKDEICIRDFRIYEFEIDTDECKINFQYHISNYNDVASFLDENLH